MKSILILCDMFPPAFGPRMGYLCKYLKANNINPVVVTEYIPDETFRFLKGDTEVTYINYYATTSSKVRRAALLLLDMFFCYKDVRLYREALKKTEGRNFDLILCSTYRTFPLVAASRLALKTGLPLVVDLRDIIEQYSGTEFIAHRLPRLFGLEGILAAWFRRRSLGVRNRALGRASVVTTVSPWHVETLKRYKPHLIYNGFDPEIFFPSPKPAERFNITYTGRLLSTAMRDPSLLFEAVEKLAAEGIISPERFVIRWYMDEKSEEIIRREASKYPLAVALMSYNAYVPALEIPGILNESNILLLLTNKSAAKGPKGVMTTKFFEYLAVQKPILCVRGDEALLEKTIADTHSGISAHTATEAYVFIKNLYQQWLSDPHSPITTYPKREEILKFSRASQAGQFMELFENLHV